MDFVCDMWFMLICFAIYPVRLWSPFVVMKLNKCAYRLCSYVPYVHTICSERPGTGHKGFIFQTFRHSEKLESTFCFTTSGLHVACHCQWTLATAGGAGKSPTKKAPVPLMGPVTYGEGDRGFWMIHGKISVASCENTRKIIYFIPRYMY